MSEKDNLHDADGNENLNPTEISTEETSSTTDATTTEELTSNDDAV